MDNLNPTTQLIFKMQNVTCISQPLVTFAAEDELNELRKTAKCFADRCVEGGKIPFVSNCQRGVIHFN